VGVFVSVFAVGLLLQSVRKTVIASSRKPCRLPACFPVTLPCCLFDFTCLSATMVNEIVCAGIPALKKAAVTKTVGRPSKSGAKEAGAKNKAAAQAVVKASDRVHLLRLTESTVRRAIVALQLAPSMTNSPVKCNNSSMSLTDTVAGLNGIALHGNPISKLRSVTCYMG